MPGLEVAGFVLALAVALAGWGSVWLSKRDQNRLETYGLKRDVGHLLRDRDNHSLSLVDLEDRIIELEERISQLELHKDQEKN